MQSASADEPPVTIKGTVISQEYTVILRDSALAFYHADKGPWEKRNTPDFLLTADETEALFAFLLLVLPAQTTKTKVFET